MGGGLFKLIIFGVDNLFCCDLGGGGVVQLYFYMAI